MMHRAKSLKRAQEDRKADSKAFQALAKGWNVKMGLRRGDRVVPGRRLQRAGVKRRHLKRKSRRVHAGSSDDDSDSDDVLGHMNHMNSWSVTGMIRKSFLALGKSISPSRSHHETSVNMGEMSGGMQLLAASIVSGLPR